MSLVLDPTEAMLTKRREPQKCKGKSQNRRQIFINRNKNDRWIKSFHYSWNSFMTTFISMALYEHYSTAEAFQWYHLRKPQVMLSARIWFWRGTEKHWFKSYIVQAQWTRLLLLSYQNISRWNAKERKFVELKMR